ncbi:MAG: cupin domain-containing protein [Burkholderiales bacterium]|nr:cupin domain-containing protein [Burkholderiales bacterium]
MQKPLVNLDEVEFDDIEDNGYYTSKRALFSASIGARKLGYNLTELPPGKSQCPFHSHREEEEMFLILDGEGELRFGNQRFKLRKHDVIACPTGDASVAHQIINTGTTPMRYLSLSNQSSTEGGADDFLDYLEGSSCIHTRIGFVPCGSTSSWVSTSG